MSVLMMLALQLPFLGHGAPVETRAIAVRPWTVVVSRDRFDGTVSCKLQSRRVIIQDGVVMFDLGARTDTLAAAYRLDDGPARTDLAALPQSLDSALLDRTPLDNTSNGLVAVSLAAVAGAHHVDVRANPKARPVSFDLKGLEAALKVQAAQPCGGAKLAAAGG